MAVSAEDLKLAIVFASAVENCSPSTYFDHIDQWAQSPARFCSGIGAKKPTRFLLSGWVVLANSEPIRTTLNASGTPWFQC